jgi:type IV pilus assembly protein PilZ
MSEADEDTGESGSDRRIAYRLPMRVLVEYECAEDFLVDYTSNVSVGGIFIKTDHPLELGSRFRLRFRLPGMARPIDTYGVVCWAQRPEESKLMVAGMGVAFEELSDQDVREVEALIKVSMKTLKLCARSAASPDNEKDSLIPKRVAASLEKVACS